MAKMGSEAREAVRVWNSRVRPGDRVLLLLDSGQKVETTTRSEAWVLSDGYGPAVVLVEGFTGGYALDRVEPVSLLDL
jgi:hypothetical protein